MGKKCIKCGKEAGFFKSMTFYKIGNEEYCADCGKIEIEKRLSTIKITTTNNIEGYRVIEYIDIDSAEVVIGTGLFSEVEGNLSDFFGARSSGFEEKLAKGKKYAMDKLKYNAMVKGGNAIIGVDLSYTEFDKNRIGIIVSGTVVKIEKN